MREQAEIAVIEKLFEALENKQTEELAELLADDFERDSNAPSADEEVTGVTLIRCFAVGDAVFTLARWSYNWRQERAISIFEFDGPRIIKWTDYFGNVVDASTALSEGEGDDEEAQPGVAVSDSEFDEEESPERVNRRLVRDYWRALAAGHLDRVADLRSESYILEWPQSGERVRGKQNARAIEEEYKATAAFESQKMLGRDDMWVVEGVLTSGDQTTNIVSVVEVENGKISRQTDYFTDPFEAPEWRSKWVERIITRS